MRTAFRIVVILAAVGLVVARQRNRSPGSAETSPQPAQPTPSPAVAPQGDTVVSALRSAPQPARDIAAIQERLREAAPSTYILHMLPEQGDTLARWPDRMRDALRVWIQPDASFPDWNSEYPVVAERAFEEWQLAGFPMRFDRVRDSVGADIKIVFVHQMPADEPVRRIGVARRVRDQDGWLVYAEVVIATHDRGGSPLPPEIIGGTARHEIGHVLGLGHSPNPTDVMYPESRSTVISATDRATLHLIYTLPPGSVR